MSQTGWDGAAFIASRLFNSSSGTVAFTKYVPLKAVAEVCKRLSPSAVRWRSDRHHEHIVMV